MRDFRQGMKFLRAEPRGGFVEAVFDADIAGGVPTFEVVPVALVNLPISVD